MLSDQELVERLRFSDNAAYNELYHRYVNRLYGFALTIVKSPELAEDVVHDVFVKVWEKSADIDPSQSFQSWIFTITRNQLLNTIKRSSTEKRILAEILAQTIPISDHTNEMHQLNETEILLHEAITKLPNKRRHIFLLCKYHDFSYQEAADLLGITESTVNSQMVKALRFIKAYVEQKNRIAVAIATMFLF